MLTCSAGTITASASGIAASRSRSARRSRKPDRVVEAAVLQGPVKVQARGERQRDPRQESERPRGPRRRARRVGGSCSSRLRSTGASSTTVAAENGSQKKAPDKGRPAPARYPASRIAACVPSLSAAARPRAKARPIAPRAAPPARGEQARRGRGRRRRARPRTRRPARPPRPRARTAARRSRRCSGGR